MDLRELYDQIGGSYDEAIGRLRTEPLVGTFVVRFAADASIPNLLDAWSRGDEQAAFEAAHAAKGVCQNLVELCHHPLATDIGKIDLCGHGRRAMRERIHGV